MIGVCGGLLTDMGVFLDGIKAASRSSSTGLKKRVFS